MAKKRAKRATKKSAKATTGKRARRAPKPKPPVEVETPKEPESVHDGRNLTDTAPTKPAAPVEVETFEGTSTPDPKPKRKGSLSRATAMRLVACDTCGEKFLPERGFRTGRKYRHLPNWRSTTCKKCEDKAK